MKPSYSVSGNGFPKERRILSVLVMSLLIISGLIIVAVTSDNELSAAALEMPDDEDGDGIITLDQNVNLQSTYVVPEGITKIDLGNCTVNGPVSGYAIQIEDESNVTIVNGRIVSANNSAVLCKGTINLGDESGETNVTIISSGIRSTALLLQGGTVNIYNTTVRSDYGFGIVLVNSDKLNNADSIPSKLNFYSGSVTSSYFTVSGNNLYSADSEINIMGGSFTTTSEEVGMYFPMECEVKISGSTITSAGAGIEIRMGSLTLENTTVIANGAYDQDMIPQSGSTSSNGAALLVTGQFYGNNTTQYQNSTDLTVIIGEGTVLNSAHGNSVDLFNMNNNDSGVQDVTVDINVSVDSIRTVEAPTSRHNNVIEVTVAEANSIEIGGDFNIDVEGVPASGTSIWGKVDKELTLPPGSQFTVPQAKELVVGGSNRVADVDFIMEPESSISFDTGSSFKGEILDSSSNALDADVEVGTSAFTIGSPMKISGSGWSGDLTVSGNEVTISGTPDSSASIKVKANEDGSPSNIVLSVYNGPSLTQVDQNGNPSDVPVANITYNNAEIGGVSVSLDFNSVGYDGQAKDPPEVTLQSSETISKKGYLRLPIAGEVADVSGIYCWVEEDEVPTIWSNGSMVMDAVDAGTYAAKYAYIVNGSTTVIDCAWTITTMEISVSDVEVLDKVYDGTSSWNGLTPTFTNSGGSQALPSIGDYYVTATSDSSNSGTVTVSYTITLNSQNWTFADGSNTYSYSKEARINPIVVTESMVSVSTTYEGDEATISVSVSSNGLCPSGFAGSLVGPGTELVSGSNPYVVSVQGTYTYTLSEVSDSNWSLSESITKIIEVTLPISQFYTATGIDGGTPDYSKTPEAIMYGSQIVLPEPQSIPEGYKFVGWSSGSEVYQAGTTVSVTGNMAFYAVYMEIPSPEGPDYPGTIYPPSDDDYVPLPPIQVEEPQDDDSTTIVACAAAAVVAALMAVFLIIEYRKR